jgi:hypothetical protein
VEVFAAGIFFAVLHLIAMLNQCRLFRRFVYQVQLDGASKLGPDPEWALRRFAAVAADPPPAMTIFPGGGSSSFRVGVF